ncbi:MAG: Crp/Fnr family transcriptional regulator [Chitinophagaceae bacterium]|nr:Crp/Fnr family transcriptional regulator [Chitinophagaceae bacterium]
MTTAQKILMEIGRFSENEIAMFEKVIKPAFFSKEELLLNKGEICSSVFYIIKGAAYQFTDEDIDENIIGLHIEGDWCLNYSSFINQKPSNAIIKCYTDLEVVELPITTIHELIALSPSFFQLAKVLEDTRVRYFDNASTALQKHNQLFLSRSVLFQKFPLKMIASYLSITPETLSRIRSIK